MTGRRGSHWWCDCGNVNHETRKSCLACSKIQPKEPKWLRSGEF